MLALCKDLLISLLKVALLVGFSTPMVIPSLFSGRLMVKLKSLSEAVKAMTLLTLANNKKPGYCRVFDTDNATNYAAILARIFFSAFASN